MVQKKRKYVQRIQHLVRFDIGFDSRNDQRDISKPLINFVQTGSISDNKLGGWYSYRASKTALNQIVKNFSIEIKRTNPNSIFIGLQPGTVKSNLSKPFEKNVQSENLFTPEYSATKLLDVLDSLTFDDSGKLYAWNGEEIQP